MDIRKIIKASLFTPTPRGWGLPAAFEDEPGTGKTSIIEQVAHECGLMVETLSPGERGEGAFGCVPVPVQVPEETAKRLGVDTVLSYPVPEWAIKFIESGRGVVFVDELTTAPPALQPPMLGLFLERRIGGNRLPRGVRMLAAYNDASCAANGHELPAPIANRMGHNKWDAGNAEAHADHMVATIGDLACVTDMSEADAIKGAAQIDPAAEEERVKREWPAASAWAVGVYSAFINAKSESLHNMPPAHDPQVSKSWPSRRTWDYAVRALAACKIHDLQTHDKNGAVTGLSPEGEALICSFIGEGVGGEFVAFVSEQDLPDARDVLDGKVEFKHDPRRLDRTYVVLDSCTALVTPKEADKRDARAKSLWKILKAILDSGAKDVVYTPARRLAKAGHLRHAEARPVLAKLNKVMEAAGIEAR